MYINPEPMAERNSWNADISHDELLCLLNYDPLTGVFTWQSASGTRVDLIGSAAGSSDKRGAVFIRLHQIRYAAHRLAWFYMTGAWPENLIDHRDGNPANNKWLNLREATRRMNNENKRAASSQNLWTNYLGVSENVKKRKKYLGLYPTDHAAFAAYVTDKRTLHAGNTL